MGKVTQKNNKLDLRNQRQVIVQLTLISSSIVWPLAGNDRQAAIKVNLAENQSNFFIVRHHSMKFTLFSPAARFSGQFESFFCSNRSKCLSSFSNREAACASFRWPWTFLVVCLLSLRHSSILSLLVSWNNKLNRSPQLKTLIPCSTAENWPQRICFRLKTSLASI